MASLEKLVRTLREDPIYLWLSRLMQITINKPRLTVLAALIFAASMFMLFFGPPNEGHPVKPKNPGLILFTDTVLILLGIAVQRWARDKPRYQLLGLMAYFCTLLMCSALSYGLLATLLGKFF